MPTSYSNLMQYRQCPRLFGFQKLGYKPVWSSEPLQTGSLAHIGLAAYFKGMLTEAAIAKEAASAQSLIDKHLSGDSQWDASANLATAKKRAMELTARYIAHWGKDYTAPLSELELELGGVICHPDLIAYYQEQRVIVDFKTSYHPDERWYDVSNQCDLYALVVNLLERAGHPDCSRVSMIIYDVISEEGIFRHQRPPRGESGLRIFRAVQELNNIITSIKPDEEHLIRHYGSIEKVGAMKLLDDPHPDYTCPTRCSFWIPCWLLETDTWESCKDYLEANFIKEVKSET